MYIFHTDTKNRDYCYCCFHSTDELEEIKGNTIHININFMRKDQFSTRSDCGYHPCLNGFLFFINSQASGMRTILAAALSPLSRSENAWLPCESGRVSTQLRSPKRPVSMALTAALTSAAV